MKESHACQVVGCTIDMSGGDLSAAEEETCRMLSVRRMSPAPSVTSASIPPGPSFTLHKPEWDSQQRGNCRNAPLGVAAAVMPAPQAMIRTSTTSMPCNTTAIVWHAVARRRKHVLFSIDHVLQAAAHVALPERREAEARCSATAAPG